MWHSEVRQDNKHAKIVLCGTKYDIATDIITEAEINATSQQLDSLFFMETSVFENLNVKKLFDELIISYLGVKTNQKKQHTCRFL